MNKHPEITDATKQAFIDAFLIINQTTPIEKITVRTLIEKAGYSRTTFYNYFSDVYELYAYIEQFVFENIKKNIELNFINVGSEEDFITRFAKVYEEWGDYLRVLTYNTYSRQLTLHIKKTMIDFWIGEFDLPKDDIKLNYKLDFMVSGILSIFGKWLIDNDNMKPEEVAGIARETISKGLVDQIKAYI